MAALTNVVLCVLAASAVLADDGAHKLTSAHRQYVEVVSQQAERGMFKKDEDYKAIEMISRHDLLLFIVFSEQILLVPIRL